MILHWIAHSLSARQSTAPEPVTLSASITGTFDGAAALKASGGQAPALILHAIPIRTTDQVGGNPTSRIVLPKQTPAGLYDLHTAMSSGGSAVAGDSIIRVSST